MNFFTPTETECRCGCGMQIDDALLKQLNDARAIAGVPFVITSGARCPWHNKQVGGVEDSSHTKGLAVDIAVPSSERTFHIMKGLMDAGFKRIGWNQSKKFIHADIDYAKALPSLFKY